MLTIPSSLQTVFDAGQGLTPRFILGINWETTGSVEYSTEEFDTWPDVYKYVEEFSGYESVSQVDGMSQVSSIEITFNDFYGHMKEMLDKNDIFDKANTCDLYLTTHNGTERMKLFEGGIKDPLDWSEDGKKLTLSIVSSLSDGIIGYTPSIDDVSTSEPSYDYWEEFFVGQPWPEVFGQVRYYPLAKVAERKYCETVEEETYDSGQTTVILPIDDLRTFATDDTKAEAEVYVNLVGEIQGKFSIIAQGRFHTKAQILTDFPLYSGEADYGFVITDSVDVSDNKITDTWYKTIPFEFLDTDGLGEDTSDGDVDPPTRIKLLLGDDYDSLNSYIGEDWQGNTLTGSDDDAWIQFMKARFSWSFSTSSTTQVAKIVDQTGNICTLDRKLSLITDPTLTSNERMVWAKKAITKIWKIPVGTKIFSMTDKDFYIADLKKDTVISDVYIDTGDGMKPISRNQYTVENNTGDTTAASGIWQENTGISSEIWVKSTDSNLPEEYTVVSLASEAFQRYLEGYQEEGVEAEVWATAKATPNTDLEVLKYLGVRYGDLDPLSTVIDSPTLTPATSTNFIFLEEEDIEEVFPEICWQGKKGLVRYIDSNENISYKLVDISTPSQPVFAFDDSNILLDSIKYSFTPVEEVVTHIDAVASGDTYNREPLKGKRVNNKTKYGEKKYEADFYIHNTRAVVTDALDFWIGRLSSIRRMVSFTGFMDSFGLEVWDRVSISFSDPSFYDTTKGIPFDNVHVGAPISWQSEGWVREVRPDIQNGLVNFVVELDVLSSESPSQGIRVSI